MQSQILHLLHFLRHAERKTFYLVDWRLQSSLWGWIKKNKFRLEHGCVLCPLFEFVWLKTILTSECSFSLSSILRLWGFSGFRPHPTLPHTQAHAHPAKQQIVTYRQKDTHTQTDMETNTKTLLLRGQESKHSSNKVTRSQEEQSHKCINQCAVDRNPDRSSFRQSNNRDPNHTFPSAAKPFCEEKNYLFNFSGFGIFSNTTGLCMKTSWLYSIERAKIKVHVLIYAIYIDVTAIKLLQVYNSELRLIKYWW